MKYLKNKKDSLEEDISKVKMNEKPDSSKDLKEEDVNEQKTY